MNKTEEIIEKMAEVRRNQFITGQRIMDCLESTNDRKKCTSCPDKPVCRRVEDALGR